MQILIVQIVDKRSYQLIVIVNCFLKLLATFDKRLPILNPCLKFKLNFDRSVRGVFFIFGFALHAEKFLSFVFALFKIAEVDGNITSVTVTLDIVLLGPFVECG